MTVITVIAPLTTFSNGKLTLKGDYDTSKLTVRDVKVFILEELMRGKTTNTSPCEELPSPSHLTIDKLRLWWNGYLLDKDPLALDQ
jgi:hypothetical protein